MADEQRSHEDAQKLSKKLWWAALVQGVAVVVAAALFLAVGNAWLEMRTFISAGGRFTSENAVQLEREMKTLIETEARLIRQQTLQYQGYASEQHVVFSKDLKSLHEFVEEVCRERKKQ